MMSTTSATLNSTSQRAITTIASESALATGLFEKASKSGIPIGPLTPAAGTRSVPPQSEAACPHPSTVEGILTMDCGVAPLKPGDRTLSARTESALPTFAGSRRASAKISPNVSRPKFKPGLNSNVQKIQLENQFTNKRQRYMTLKKELAEKEKQACKLYEQVAKLRDTAIAAGFKDPGKVESMRLDAERVEQTARPSLVGNVAVASEQSLLQTSTSMVTSEFIGTLKEKLSKIPNFYEEVCREALKERTEMMSWLADFSRKNESKFGLEITGRLEDFEIEGARLRSCLEEAVGKNQTIITELMQKALALWGEHEDYRIHIMEFETSGEGLVGDLKGELRAAIAELDEEREQVAQLKEQKSAADGQLQKARNRIRELEGQSNGVETKLQKLQGTIKSLEVQLRQKGTALEGRSKEMHRALKNSEGLVAKTEKQRDSLEITELKRKIDSKEAEHNRAVENLTKRLGDAENQLAAERDLKYLAERKARELGDRCANPEENSKQLCDLAGNTMGLTAKSDGKHTDCEQQLWNELQSTRSALAAQDEKLVEIWCEKEQMRLVLQQAADRDNLGCVKDRLALELPAETEVLQKTVAERAKLQQDSKTALDKSDDSEQQLCELQNMLHAQRKEGGKSGWGAHAIQFEQERCDFRTTLADLTRYNEKLETALTQKQLEVEQRDRVMQEQSKVLKVSDELTELLKERSPNANGDPNGAENMALGRQVQPDSEAINRLITAKAEDMEALHRTLDGKQMQLMRLEKVVRQMENENERSQATRTKLEREVARLRLQLNEKNRDTRNTGFIFM